MSRIIILKQKTHTHTTRLFSENGQAITSNNTNLIVPFSFIFREPIPFRQEVRVGPNLRLIMPLLLWLEQPASRPLALRLQMAVDLVHLWAMVNQPPKS